MLLRTLRGGANGGTPHLFCHGDADQRVLAASFDAAVKLLEDGSVPHTRKVYRGMGHECCPLQLADTREFLLERLAVQSGKPKDE